MVRILKHLDKKGRLAFWRYDECGIIFGFLIAGSMVDLFFIAGVAGVAICHLFYIPLKKRIGLKRIINYLYWYFPNLFTKKPKIPESYKRKWR